ncbi:hypothetical protein Rsub_10238 [Raphidocelis subcapitata]|uniref:Uncharacterized protein n=1 Tax=Raphidocelis subcapitata TaxID=307507 RepID=A0A2V0PIU8_9CHLO|nr:hypothetical protein Rsub_10238 [Raphidocelis subcapitata]|eukprot:GBF97883.1 hypothetical protein Rsub_10238 [Raphidocelis subcapitata]
MSMLRLRAASSGPRAVRGPRAAPVRPRRVSVAAGAGGAGNKDVDAILAEANALLNAVTAGGEPLPGVQESIDELTALGFVCDESGCVLVLPTESSDDEAANTLNTYISGRGWGLGMLEGDDEDSADFPAQVTGPGWSVPLTEGELGDLLMVLQQLRGAVQLMAAQGQWLPAGGDRPVSRAKWQSRHIGMQASWAPSDSEPAFTVELTFRSDRRTFTTVWPSDVASAVCRALDGGASPTGAPSAAAARSIAGAA